MKTWLIVLALACVAGSATAGEKHRVAIYTSQSFQFGGALYQNVVVVPVEGTMPEIRGLEDALRLPTAQKVTIRGSAVFGPDFSYAGTLDADKRRLTFDYTDNKGKPKTKNFYIFSSGWTSPEQIR